MIVSCLFPLDELRAGQPQQKGVRAAADFSSRLNAIHPFRDGNGQLAFMALLASKAGHPLQLEHLNPGSLLQAMIRSFHADNDPLVRELRRPIDGAAAKEV